MADIDLKQIEENLLKAGKDNTNRLVRDLVIVQNRLYSQLESLSWLQRCMTIKGALPPLRGWAASPDVLRLLHNHITSSRPQVIVEFGSGASTVVIADALKQNRSGKLFSIEHIDFYGEQTRAVLAAEQLENWVDLRIAPLEAWLQDHLNPVDAEKPSSWYAPSLLNGIDQVDLLWVDGPPGKTCLFSRYPALPALGNRLAPKAEIWMDDTVRQEEKDICERWAKDYGFEIEYLAFEKGLGRLTRPNANSSKRVLAVQSDEYGSQNELNLEKALGLDFSLPENN